METVSVIIATFNRRKLLAQCLEALWAGALPLEVIAVDDGSSDGTADFLKDECGRNPCLRVLRQRNRGQAAARNAGASQAKGSVLAFTDDDCRPGPGWVQSIQKEFTDRPVLGSEGPVLGLRNDEIISPFTHYIHNPRGPGYLTCNLAVRRSVFLEHGGFDERFRMHEDTDLCLRILRKGSISFNPDMIVEHPPRRYDLFRDLTRAPSYAARYVESERLLYERNPQDYGTVRYHPTFRKTFASLAVKYTWLFFRVSRAQIQAYPLDTVKLLLLTMVRHLFVNVWLLSAKGIKRLRSAP